MEIAVTDVTYWQRTWTLLGLALAASAASGETDSLPVQAVDSAWMPESPVTASPTRPPALPEGAAVAIDLAALSAQETS